MSGFLFPLLLPGGQMNNGARVKLIWLSALVFFAAGIVMTVHNLRSSELMGERFRKQIGELKILKNQEIELARHEAARKKYDQISEKKPVSLNAILQETLAGVKVDDVRESRKDLVDGWSIRQKEVSISEVSLGRVMDFIQKAESQKLPWSLARFIVRAAPRTAGTGQVVLVMECLEKAE